MSISPVSMSGGASYLQHRASDTDLCKQLGERFVAARPILFQFSARETLRLVWAPLHNGVTDLAPYGFFPFMDGCAARVHGCTAPLGWGVRACARRLGQWPCRTPVQRTRATRAGRRNPPFLSVQQTRATRAASVDNLSIIVVLPLVYAVHRQKPAILTRASTRVPQCNIKCSPWIMRRSAK